MADFVVAYYIPHNDGIEKGIIDGPGFDSETTLVDLYEVDGVIRSFAAREEAQAWLDEQNDDYDLAPETYSIWRYYQDERIPAKMIVASCDLEQAQEHCKREDTHGDGWFDGYRSNN